SRSPTWLVFSTTEKREKSDAHFLRKVRTRGAFSGSLTPSRTHRASGEIDRTRLIIRGGQHDQQERRGLCARIGKKSQRGASSYAGSSQCCPDNGSGPGVIAIEKGSQH